MSNRERYLTDSNADNSYDKFGKGLFIIEMPVGRQCDTTREIEFKKNTAYSALEVLKEINTFYYSLANQKIENQ